MTRYIEILAVQRPFPFTTDANGRIVFSVNFTALAVAPVADFKLEIVKLINNAGYGTLGTDVFIGPTAVIPTGDGPYVSIIDTGGISTVEVHNGGKKESLSFQIIVRAIDYLTAETRAIGIWRTLDGKRNVDVAA